MGWLEKYWLWRTHRKFNFIVPMTVYEYVNYLENAKYIYVDVRAGGEIYLWYRPKYQDVGVESYLTIENIDNVNTKIAGMIQSTSNTYKGWKWFIYILLIMIVFLGLFDATGTIQFPIAMLLGVLISIPSLVRNREDYVLEIIKRA